MIWVRWAMASSAEMRRCVRKVTGIYNQWPVIVRRTEIYLPIGDRPAPLCLANDNGPAE